MKLSIFKSIPVLFSLFFLLSLFMACETKSKLPGKEYISYAKSDTAYLYLVKYDKTFYGKLKVVKRGNVIDSGEVEGSIVNDQLLGSYLYRPHGDRYSKRNAFVLLDRSDSLILGSGIQSVYMGVPSYLPNSITFNNPKFVFKPVKSN